MNLSLLPKIGPKTINLLSKLNILTIEDLLNYYPYKYNIIKYSSIDKCTNDEKYYVIARVISAVKVKYFKKNLNALEFFAENNNQQFKVIIFNRAFLKKQLPLEKEIIVVGKYNSIKKTFTASEIKFHKENEKIESIYHLTEGLKQSTLQDAIKSALNLDISINDPIPSYISNKYNFITKNEAIQKIHLPENYEDIKKSSIRLIYEELFTYTFKMNYLKNIQKNKVGLIKKINEELLDSFLSSLNFHLTKDQEITINDILTDLKNNKRMNRLVLGDVGSGKTIVAIVALLANYSAGYQGTFMAPTEILAQQHFKSIKEYFKDYDINIFLLTGNATKKEKEAIYQAVLDGTCDIVIGTHALLTEKLQFKNLGLVVTDEQHRFGVNQRNIIQNKGLNNLADVLYLSATPIPRTYALTIYGDLDLSQIKTKPSIRKEVKTKIVEEKNIKEVLYKIYEELKNNNQIFIVSPLIEQNDELDLSSVNKLKDKLNLAFNNKVPIAILHGKQKENIKAELMRDFKDGKIKILISTTVIEVGIDIPKASVMVIFNAERFGLATLHQLRGRVGRSNIQSYCYLITKDNTNPRLKVMEESTDGFYIAEKDFEQRGQGDLFGSKQSGDMTFKIASFQRDYKILLQASKDSMDFINNNLYLEDSYYQVCVNNLTFLD